MSGIRSNALSAIFLSGLVGALFPASRAFAELLFDVPNVALTGRVNGRKLSGTFRCAGAHGTWNARRQPS